MNKSLMKMLGVFAGLLVAFAAVIGVEAFSAVVHPFPVDMEQTYEAICRHVENYPPWVLAIVVPMWMASAYAGVSVAALVGGRVSAIIVGCFVLAALFLNLWMAPYPIWFRVAMVIAGPVSVWLAIPKKALIPTPAGPVATD